MATKKCKIHFEPSGLAVDVTAGTTLLQAANTVGIYLTSICGGDGYCGKCKLFVDEGQFKNRPTTLLTPDEISKNTVLACQTQVLSDMTVTVPQWHDIEGGRILKDDKAARFKEMIPGRETAGFKFDPLVQKIYLEMKEPSINDYTADHERLYLAIREAIDTDSIQTGLRTLQKLSRVIQTGNYKVTATIGRRGGTTEVIDVEPGDQSKRNYTIAVDLGTTTVVAQLIDASIGSVSTGSVLDTEATYNSQINFGEDYIHRIIYGEEHDAFDQLQTRLANDVNDLIITLASRCRIHLQDITSCICSGNTAMTHFLLRLDATRIRREPYVASADFIPPIRAVEAGIHINKRGLLYCLPSVAAYVGGDIVSGVLATRIYEKEGVSLLVDIGTNGEVALVNKEWIVCASSSAGPAFEGSGVKQGMRASTGAIEQLQIDKSGLIKWKMIGSGEPIGICGSGLLDVLAELASNQIIDRTGRFSSLDDLRISEGDCGMQFQLVPARKGHEPIVITQSDINNLIRSKAGVFSAIRVLMGATQTRPEDLNAIYLAGGFGNYLNIQHAIEIGMLPDIPVERIHFVGNTSMRGAKEVSLSREALQTAENLAVDMTYFDLMSHPGYMDEFIKASFLPYTDLTLFPSVRCSNQAFS
ncbi:MAG: ASKHA domain-containing protein [Planctomycetota bacterium]